MKKVLNDLHVVEHKEYEKWYYFTDNMIRDGIFIDETHIFHADKLGTNEATTVFISVKHISNDNAEEFNLYQGYFLEGIQLYRFLKDIKDIYDENHKEAFLEILNDFSGSYSSSQMQEKARVRFEIRTAMLEEINYLKENA